ncbi:MAG: LPS-assembly protein LptD [Caulobacterales bacterium]
MTPGRRTLLDSASLAPPPRRPRSLWPFGAALAGALLAASGSAMAQPAPSAAQADDPVVVLEADRLYQDEASNLIIAEGRVEARYGGRLLRAERVVYDRGQRTVRAQGSVQLIDADGSVRSADELEVTEDLGAGVAVGFGAKFVPNGTIAANTAVRRADGSSQLERMAYTACPVCKDGKNGPTWSLRARRATQNPDTKMISYRDARLAVRGVPVLYLPYFAHPDPGAGRRSGFLAPDIGRTGRLGLFWDQPYYWAISPSQEVTVSAQLHQFVNPLLKFDYRKRFWSGQVSIAGSLTDEQDFGDNGDKFGEQSLRGHVFATGLFDINSYWQWGFGLERTSDDLYLRRYQIAGAGDRRGKFLGDYARLVSQVNLSGQDEASYVSVSALSIQGLRAGDTSLFLPQIAPLIEAERVVRDPVFDGQLRLQTSAVNLSRSSSEPQSSRVSGGFKWSRDRVFGPGLIMAPFAEARTDVYSIRNGPVASGDDTLTRSVGVAGVQVRWPFIKPGANTSWVVEPIAMAALGSSGGNDARIVNEDSLAFEMDGTALFNPNGVPGYDLWEPGPRAAYGVRTTVNTDAGSASLLVGQRWRGEASDRFRPGANLPEGASDLVAALSADFRRFGGGVRLQLDDRNLNVNRLDANVRGSIGRLSASVRYFDIDPTFVGAANPARELQANLGARVTKHWSLDYGNRRDLQRDINLSQDLRATYRDDCTFLELAYRRTETFDRNLGPDEGFSIRVGLMSLGAPSR